MVPMYMCVRVRTQFYIERKDNIKKLKCFTF